MDIGKWFHRLFNPHCPDCRAEYEAARMEEHERREESKVCVSCDMLKQMNDHLRMDNEKLMRRLLDKPEPETIQEAKPMQTRPVALPWRVRQQMLEAEDRKKAELIRKAPKPLEVVSTEELEKDLDIASAAREAEAATTKS